MINKKQMEAVSHFSGAALVLAGPGTGKTTVITERVRYLIEEQAVLPENILVVTFTKAAAIEMQERFVKMMDDGHVAKSVCMGTFHSVFYTILKESSNLFVGKMILSDKKKSYLVKEIVLRLNLQVGDISEFVKEVVVEIGKVKSGTFKLDKYKPTSCPKEMFLAVYLEYEQSLAAEGYLDFDDILLKCNELLKSDENILKIWQDRFKYILIDEFQDVNRIQYENIKLIAGKSQNVFAVGDDDQAIYSFRGSDVSIMKRFVREYRKVKKVYLNTNYRCTNQILTAADNLIKHNQDRFDKKLIAHKDKGREVEIRRFSDNILQYNYISEKIKEYNKKGVAYNEMAVLVRNNQSAINITNFFASKKIESSTKSNGNIYSHAIARDVVAYIKAALSDESLPLFSNSDIIRIINKPYRYISRQYFYENGPSLKELKDLYGNSPQIAENIARFIFHLQMIRKMDPYAAVNYIRYGADYEKHMKEYAHENSLKIQEVLNIYDRITRESINFKTLQQWLSHIEESTHINESAKGKNGVNINTIHLAKGLEYRVVFIPDVNQGILPEKRSEREGNLDEERRLFYVAITRASEALYVFSSDKIMGREYSASQFVNEMCECLHF